MPAREQELADSISIWGRLQIILRGGNREVVATALWGLDESFLVSKVSIMIMGAPQAGQV